MSGFLLGLALVLTPIGIMWSSWLGFFADARRNYHLDLAEMEEQRRDWHNYRNRPGATQAQHKKLYAAQQRNRPLRPISTLERRYFIIMTVLLALEVFLVIRGFVRWPHQPGHGIMWGYTAVVVLGLVWWFILLWESDAVRPEYARNHHHHPLIPSPYDN